MKRISAFLFSYLISAPVFAIDQGGEELGAPELPPFLAPFLLMFLAGALIWLKGFFKK